MTPECALSMVAKDCPNEGDSVEFNFLPTASRAMRQAEVQFGQSLIAPLIEAISDCEEFGASTRLFIGSLLRLVPSRQSDFEHRLAVLLPNWREFLGSPSELPVEFHIASAQAATSKITLPTQLCPALATAAQSELVDVALTAMTAMQRLGCITQLEVVNSLCKSANEAVSRGGVLTLARLRCLADKNATAYLEDLVVDSSQSTCKRLAALDGLITSADDNSLPNAIRLVDSIGNIHQDAWAFEHFLDIGSKELAKLVERSIKNCDLKELPDSTSRRIARSQWLDPKIRSAATEKVASNRVNSEKATMRSRSGLLVHRNSSGSALWIGHCGIFIDEDTLIHCTTGSDPRAVHQIGYDDWRAGLECWGIRRDSHHNIDLNRAVERAREIASWRTEYDGAHNNQKGEWFKGWNCSAEYWESDCVGFTERVYEDVGGNPVHDEGMLLKPRDQRNEMTLVMSC